MDIIYTIWLRNMKRFLRSKSRIVGSIAMPLFFLLFLGVGLNSVVQLPGLGENYIVFLIPGMVAMSVLFTSVFSGIQIIWDKQFGFLKETLVAPVSRLEIMSGQTLGGATTAVIQGSLILVLSVFGRVPADKSGWFSYRSRIHGPDRYIIHRVWYRDCITDGRYDRFPAHHEFCRLPDIRLVRGTLSYQLIAGVDDTAYPARSPDLWGGRYPLRSYRCFADQSAGLWCGYRGFHPGDDHTRGIPVQENQDLKKRVERKIEGN